MSLGGVGFTVSNIIHTVKRFFVVLYPPAIAIYLLSEDLKSLFYIIYTCYFSAAIVACVVFLNRDIFQRILARQIHAFGSGGSLWKAWTWAETPECGHTTSEKDHGPRLNMALFSRLCGYISSSALCSF